MIYKELPNLAPPSDVPKRRKTFIAPKEIRPREPGVHFPIIHKHSVSIIKAPSMSSAVKRPICHVLIIGAGLCGLVAAISVTLEGHQATVFESAVKPHEVGAGIQITPNGVRILRKLGVTARLESKAAVPNTFTMIRYDGRKLLAHRGSYSRELESRYEEPIWCLHRVDLQEALAKRAEELGVRLVFGRRVRDVNFARPEIICDNGQMEKGDLVIAADGIWSSTRSAFLGKPLLPNPTGDLAYRIVLTADKVRDDVELHDIIRCPGIRIWMGPYAHAVAYSLLGGQMLNVVLLVRDNLPPDVAKAEGDLEEMVKLFEGWDPLLRKLLSHVKKVDKWRLMYLELDEPWTSKQGTFTMAGDSCHPILPYMAQGANSALEDGATLGALLGKIDSKSQIPAVTALYEKMRKERTNKIRLETFKQQEEHHLVDGEPQQARDKHLARSFDTQDEWTHPRIQPWLFGYDAHKEASRAWDSQIPPKTQV